MNNSNGGKGLRLVRFRSRDRGAVVGAEEEEVLRVRVHCAGAGGALMSCGQHGGGTDTLILGIMDSTHHGF